MEKKNITLIPPDELFGEVEKLLKEGYYAEFTVTGNSMWPFLAHGRDSVTVCDGKNMPLKKGDIVLFCPEKGRYLLHRVTHVKDGLFCAAGDGNTFYDGYFPFDSVVGKVVSFCRKEKIWEVNSYSYKLLSRMWMIGFPVRRGLLYFLRLVARRRG